MGVGQSVAPYDEVRGDRGLQKETTESSVPSDAPLVRDKLHEGDEPESMTTTGLQILFPFLLAGCGMVAAGLVLDTVTEWDVFVHVTEIFILVPALLGLKGNLEMTLASRLSTHASLGDLDSMSTGAPIIVGNLALIQCQGIAVGFLASVVAMVMSYATGDDVSFDHWVLMCSASCLTASLASFVLACVMVGVVVASRIVGCNPDNVAAPIAASLGDITTLALLAYFAERLWQFPGINLEIGIICGYCLIVAPVCGWLASREPNSALVLRTGWTPVLASMVISSSGGLVMAKFEDRFPRMAAFQPVMNGAGGNLVAVQASRIGTHLHKQSELGHLVEDEDSYRSCLPCSVFCSNSTHAKTARVLMLLVVPGHLAFFGLIHLVAPDESSAKLTFFGLYLLATLVQEWILLYACLHIVHLQWSRGIDPDSAAVPYLTALGDLCGTALLTSVFEALNQIDADEHRIDQEVAPLNVTGIVDTEAKFLVRHGLRHALRFR